MNQNKDSDFGGRKSNNRNFKSFYNFDEEAPMKFRMYLFRQQFKEFSTLK